MVEPKHGMFLQFSLSGALRTGSGGLRGFAAAPQVVDKLEQFVQQIEKDNLAAKKKQYKADLSSGVRDKAHDQFWEAQRAKYEAWDAEASKAQVDPMIFTAVKEMEAVETFKVPWKRKQALRVEWPALSSHLAFVM